MKAKINLPQCPLRELPVHVLIYVRFAYIFPTLFSPRSSLSLPKSS